MSQNDWWMKKDNDKSPDWWTTQESAAGDWWNDADANVNGPIRGGGGGGAAASLIKFGVLTPAGEGEQSIIAANGTYTAGSGSFSVASNRINVVTMPAAGTYDVGGVSVQVVANARTCSTAAEIAARWMAANGTHPIGTKILIAPGTYNVFALLSGNTYLLNDWDWQAVDSSQKPILTTAITDVGAITYEPSSGSPGCSFENIAFYREQDPVGIPWNPVGYDVFTVRNSVTNMRFNRCRFYGDFIPAAQGGKLTTKLIGLATEDGAEVEVTNCEFDHLCTAVQLYGDVVVNNNTLHDIYSDFFELRAGINGEIRNNHCYNKIGDGSFLHGDWFQVQVPPVTPASGPLLIEGNTCTPGEFWNLAAGQAHAGKASPTLNTAGPHTLDIATHHGARVINCRVADAGGTMAITLDPAATYGKDATFCLYQVGVGTVTVTLSGGDTADGPLTMNSNNQAISFISDGVSNWSVIPPGYRAVTQIRTANKTLGPLEAGLGVFANASAGPLLFTLPSGTDAYTTSVKKDDTTANLVSIALPGGQTFTDHGVAGLTANRTLSRCGEVMVFERLVGTTVWTVTEATTTSQAFLSNGTVDGWDELVVRHNIFLVNSPNGFRPDDDLNLGAGMFRDCQFHNNTIFRAVPPDANGDGYIAESDSWATGVVGSIHFYNGIDTFRNAVTGNLTDNGPSLRKAENVSFGWTDPEDLSALNVYLEASLPEHVRPTTRAEVVAAARAKAGGPLVIDAPSYSYIGAVGTTSSNGPYNWDTGTVNTNTKLPQITSMVPADNSVDAYTNTTIRLNFDELITLGTGNISIRIVGGAEIESFDVASSGQLAISGNGTTLVITPTSDLPVSTNVCVRIEATAIDGYFNSFAAITDDSLNFTTGLGPLDPELLPDPGFDDAADWRGGTALVSLPVNGWSIGSGLATKASGSGTFRDIRTATLIPITAGVTYNATVTIGTISAATGNVRVQLEFFDAVPTSLGSSNTNTALSALSPGGIASHSAIAPTGATQVRVIIVSTADGGAFTLSDASLQAI